MTMFVSSKKLLASLALCLAPALTHSAVTLEQADSYWRLDGADSGTVVGTQIVDATGRHSVTAGNVQNLTWTSNVPAHGPTGSTTPRGLEFSPNVTVNPTGADNTVPSYFVSAGAGVSGSSTLLTRLKWDGAPGDDTDVTSWVVNNSLGGWVDANRAGLGYLFGITRGGNLNYYTAAPGSGEVGTGATHSFNTSTTTGLATGSTAITLQAGIWYDIAMVVNDLGDSNNATGRVTFYVRGPDGNVLTHQRSLDNIWINPTAPNNLVVGTESTGSGTGNQRKAFDGTMDYLALFDDALSQEDVLAIFAVPEPGRALLMTMALGLLTLRRRRS